MRRLSFALIGFGLGLLLVWAAVASPSCMTKREARHHWPRAHIYWHGSDRCWDNHRGRGKRDRERKRYRDPVFSSKKVATVTFQAPVPEVIEPVYRPMTFVPDLDRYMRFVPWEQRIAGSF